MNARKVGPLKLADIERAIQVLEEKSLPPVKCPRCGSGYYLIPPRGWTFGSVIFFECCGEKFAVAPPYELVAGGAIVGQRVEAVRAVCQECRGSGRVAHPYWGGVQCPTCQGRPC